MNNTTQTKVKHTQVKRTLVNPQYAMGFNEGVAEAKKEYKELSECLKLLYSVYMSETILSKENFSRIEAAIKNI
jgi:hypothetical protein